MDISETEGFQDIYEDSLRNTWTDHEHSGKIRTKDILSCVCLLYTSLVGGEDVEIIIVNDGSSDDTSKIAHEYEEKYPTIIKAVDKENGGHGDAVNSGLTHATGKYFKVVDSDDWVDVYKRQVLEYVSILNIFLHARRQEPESRARQSIIWQQDIWTGIRKNCMFLKMHCMRSGQQNWQDIIPVSYTHLVI